MLLGNINGFNILEQLKKDEELTKISVFILTNLDKEKETALKIGATKYFIKTNISTAEINNLLKN